MLVHLVALLAFYYAACVLYHTYIRHTGQVVKYYKTVMASPLLGDAAIIASRSGNKGGGKGAGAIGIARSDTAGFPGASGAAEVVTYYGIAGDLGTALVAEEVLCDRVYFKHGISLRGGGATGALVVDIGAHIGLFAMSVLRECEDVVLVGAEPVPRLHALALRNAAANAADVYIEEMAIGSSYDVGIDLVVDSFITAGTTAYRDQITAPLREHRYRSFFAFLRAVGLDNARVHNVPHFPTVLLCHAFTVPVLRELVLLMATPFLLLVAIFFAAGPHGKTKVRCRQAPLSELLERAAKRAEEDAGGSAGSHPTVAERIRGSGPAPTPINLVKIDVEGGEVGVLEGFVEAEWARIQQLVVEVHDVSGQVAAIRKLLAAKGFNHVVVDEEDWASHELLRIKTIYAKRIG